MISRLCCAVVMAAWTAASTDSASAQRRPAAPDPLAGLDGYIQDAMAKLKGVGLAIAIVKDDSIVYAKGFGVKKLGEPAPVTPGTVFAVGSTTKAFTTAALGMLVDEGRFDWDTRATNLLPGFELYDPAVTREITVRDLVTHRSGLSRGDRLWMGGSLSRGEVIRRVRYHEPSWGIRTSFGYQNIMYLAAGEIVPAVTGRSWDAFLHDRIFQPLGMTSSSTTVAGLDKQPDVATPHTEIDGTLVPIEYRNIDNVGPAGSINSNVLDMAQWIRFHLSGGTVGGRALLSLETHREMFTPQMLMRAGGTNDLLYPGANFLAYGLGWFLFDLAGRKVVEHSGGIDGMVTELIMVPSEKVGVIVLSNSGGSAVAFPVARAVINRYLGVAEDPVATVAPVLAMMDSVGKRREDSVTKARAVGKGPSAALDAYTGVFDNPMYGPARVRLIDGKLLVAVDGQEEPLDLTHWHYDTFRGASRDQRLGKTWVTFRLGSDGAVGGLTIDGLEQEFVRRPAAALAAGCDPSDADRIRLASRLSPLDSTAIFLGGRAAKVCYSRPSVRGRQVFGAALVPFDSLWRTGANDPTTIYLPFPVTIGGLAVPAGKYSVLTVPGRSRWELVLNRSLTQGTSNYATAGKPHELGRATAPVEALAEPVEQFTIRAETKGADSTELILEWERTRVRFAVKVGAP
ncbi:MAG: serine hydrolase [Gemmatimonadales bacterium]